MNQPVAYIMKRLPLQRCPTIRIVLPGLDQGYGVVFEAKVELSRTREELEALLDLVVRELPKVIKQ